MSYQIVPKNFHKDRASQCNMDTSCLDSCSLFLNFNSTVNLGFYMIHVTLSIVGTTGLWYVLAGSRACFTKIETGIEASSMSKVDISDSEILSSLPLDAFYHVFERSTERDTSLSTV